MTLFHESTTWPQQAGIKLKSAFCTNSKLVNLAQNWILLVWISLNSEYLVWIHQSKEYQLNPFNWEYHLNPLRLGISAQSTLRLGIGQLKPLLFQPAFRAIVEHSTHLIAWVDAPQISLSCKSSTVGINVSQCVQIISPTIDILDWIWNLEHLITYR